MIGPNTHVTCLNLARRPDRKLRAWGQFRKAGLKVERMLAVDALNVTDKVWHNHVGNRACTASHRLAWRAARKAGANSVLVFEDDVVLAPNFLERINKLEVPDDWDIVQFGCTFIEPPEYIGHGVVRVPGQTWDWHAMLIHSRAWPRLHEIMATLSKKGVPAAKDANDGLLGKHHAEFKVYAAWPPLAWQTFGWSNLENAIRGCWDAEGRQLPKRSTVRHLPPTRLGKFETEWQGFWESSAHFGILLNTLGLIETVVQVGLGTGGFTETVLPGWQGREWQVIPVEGEVTRPATGPAASSFRGADLTSPSTTEHSEGSLDAVWLENWDQSYLGTIAALDLWWPKLRDGGVLGGSGAANAFKGRCVGRHTWQASLAGLQEWARRNQVALIRSHDQPHENGGDGPWLMFKFTPPKPEEITVMTAWTGDIAYVKMTEENHRAYCEGRGYRYHVYRDGEFDPSRAPAWSKIPFFQEQLQKNRWVFWIDCDAIFNDWDWKIELLANPRFSMMCGIWHQHDHPRPSTGTCLIQAGEPAQELLRAVWENYPSNVVSGHEESGMKLALVNNPKFRQRVFAMPVRNLNSHPPLKDWGIDDPVLHFLQLKETRYKMIEDACAMARDRAERSGGGRLL